MLYSSVKTKRTPVSRADQDIIGRTPFKQSTYFQSINGFTINRALRQAYTLQGNETDNLFKILKGYGLSSRDAEATINTIRIMDKNMLPLDGDIQVTRYVDTNYLNAIIPDMRFKQVTEEDIDNMKTRLVGTCVKEPGYLSTTYDKDSSLFDLRPVRLDITARQGSKGLFNPTGKEAELTLARGTTYKVTDVVYDNGVVIKAVVGNE